MSHNFPDVVPQKQANRHRPAEGIFGDCHRTALAVILGLDRDDVPHFLHDDCGAAEFRLRVHSWLDSRGLSQVHILYPGSLSVEDVVQTVNFINPERPAILGGLSRTGVNHSVVIQNGEIACDPSQTDAGITGPTEPDGYFWVTYIVGKTGTEIQGDRDAEREADVGPAEAEDDGAASGPDKG